jgi:dihydroorotate dehydrogenase
VEAAARASRGRLPVIGVGGIMGAEEARAMRSAGAALVQIYTALVYRGPQVVGEILGALK